MLCKVAIYCKIYQKLVTDGGKRMFATTMTHLLTWDRLRRNWLEKLSKVFLGDLADYVDASIY